MEINDKATINITSTKLKRDLVERDIARLAMHMRNNGSRIDKAQYALLEQQLDAMERYLNILDLRIELYNERMGNNSAS
jgi:hypothetical protein